MGYQTKPDGPSLVTGGAKLSPNPFEEVALEAPPPAKRSKGVMVKDATELVAALKAKGLA